MQGFLVSHTEKRFREARETEKRYAKEKGWNVEVLKDIGSGLKEDKRNFQKLLKMVIIREVSKVIVAYPDRLVGFGFKTLRGELQN